jgi:hypothetical protein
MMRPEASNARPVGYAPMPATWKRLPPCACGHGAGVHSGVHPFGCFYRERQKIRVLGSSTVETEILLDCDCNEYNPVLSKEEVLNSLIKLEKLWR